MVDAALALLHEDGLDAVSMRRVAARLGVSPIPLYSRVGNKDDLLDAVGERILHDLLPGDLADAPWTESVAAWARALRERLRAVPDSRIVLRTRRPAWVDASRPLVDALVAAGFEADEAVRTCRLVMWAVTGFVVVEAGSLERERGRPSRARRTGVAGGDPAGVDQADADALFEQHLRYLVDGLAADRAAAAGGAEAPEGRPRPVQPTGVVPARLGAWSTATWSRSSVTKAKELAPRALVARPDRHRAPAALDVRQLVRLQVLHHRGVLLVVVEDVVPHLGEVGEPQVAVRALVRRIAHVDLLVGGGPLSSRSRATRAKAARPSVGGPALQPLAGLNGLLRRSSSYWGASASTDRSGWRAGRRRAWRGSACRCRRPCAPWPRSGRRGPGSRPWATGG